MILFLTFSQLKWTAWTKRLNFFLNFCMWTAWKCKKKMIPWSYPEPKSLRVPEDGKNVKILLFYNVLLDHHISGIPRGRFYVHNSRQLLLQCLAPVSVIFLCFQYACECINILWLSTVLTVWVLKWSRCWIWRHPSCSFFFPQIQPLHCLVPGGSRWWAAHHLCCAAVRTEVWNVLHEAPKQV